MPLHEARARRLAPDRATRPTGCATAPKPILAQPVIELPEAARSAADLSAADRAAVAAARPPVLGRHGRPGPAQRRHRRRRAPGGRRRQARGAAATSRPAAASRWPTSCTWATPSPTCRPSRPCARPAAWRSASTATATRWRPPSSPPPPPTRAPTRELALAFAAGWPRGRPGGRRDMAADRQAAAAGRPAPRVGRGARPRLGLRPLARARRARRSTGLTARRAAGGLAQTPRSPTLPRELGRRRFRQQAVHFRRRASIDCRQRRPSKESTREGQTGSHLRLQQSRSRRVRAGADRHGRRDHLDRAAPPACWPTRASRSPRSPTSPSSPRCSAAGSRPCTRASRPASSPSATTPST